MDLLGSLLNSLHNFYQKPVHASIKLDASLQGLGAVWGDQMYAITVPLGYHDFQIIHLEMLNILVAPRVWGSQWCNKLISIACDNQAVVHVLNLGKTRDFTLAAIACNAQLQLASHNIEIGVVHISGKINTMADLLSRWVITDQPLNKLNQLIPHNK